jgi:predicted ATP-binding protein involved in virulence
MRLQKILIINRAPFEKFELNFDDSNITILSGINGAGKTTVIIVYCRFLVRTCKNCIS